MGNAVLVVAQVSVICSSAGDLFEDVPGSIARSFEVEFSNSAEAVRPERLESRAFISRNAFLLIVYVLVIE